MATTPFVHDNTQVLTGNQAAAQACKLARVGVVGFFPIGPSDEFGEELTRMIHQDELSARIIELQNERSVVNAQIVATQAGVRSAFSTNSEGLAFAYQPLFWAPYGRVPIVVAVAHRAMEPPTVITTDDHDTILFRDTHWMQFYCENAQDVLDTMLQAYWVAERHDVLLPAFVTWPGWEVSHGTYPVSVPTQEQVDAFLPPYQLPPGQDFLQMDFAAYYAQRLATDAGVSPNYMEHRYKVDRALNSVAKRAIQQAHAAYVGVMGRGYGGLLEAYKTEDADVVLVAMGNIAALARDVVDELRATGMAIGSIKLRVLRPFPTEELGQLLAKTRVVMTLDRNPTHALYQEVRTALYDLDPRPRVLGRVIALGGRDFTSSDLHEMVGEALAALKEGGAKPGVEWRLRVAR